MKLLLTSNGLSNDTIADELERLVGKKLIEMKIGFIPSAAYADPDQKDWLIMDQYRMQERGAEVFIISLADLTSEEIEERLKPVDVIFVGGGNSFYLSYILQLKGLFELIPKLLETKVYAGISAGSMITTPTLSAASKAVQTNTVDDAKLENFGPEARSSAKTLSLVPFAIRPHLHRHLIDDINYGAMERVSSATGLDIYVIEDSCAVSVNGDEVKVVGEGESRHIKPER